MRNHLNLKTIAAAAAALDEEEEDKVKTKTQAQNNHHQLNHIIIEEALISNRCNCDDTHSNITVVSSTARASRRRKYSD